MFNNIISKSISDRKYNEDVYGYGDNFVFVIDGATGLGENDCMGYGDDAKWFVENVASYLNNHVSSGSIVECLQTVCEKLYAEYCAKLKCTQKVAYMPSSCISLFRIIDDKIEYYGLGDTMGYIEFLDGSYEIFYDSKLVALDNYAISEMVKIANEKGISPVEARKYIQEILVHNRSLLNTKDGYYSLELTGSGLKHAICKSWNVKDVKRVCCMSDGFYEVLDYGLYDNIQDVVNKVECDCEGIFSQLYQAQEKDALGYMVPRFKLRDDTTVVYAKVKGD